MTSSTSKKAFGLVFLLVPTLALGAAVSISLVRLETAPIMRLPLMGYDPVDILHGHYIQFQFDDQTFLDKTPSIGYGERCSCLHRIEPLSNGQNVKGEIVPCEKKAALQCDYWVSNTAFFEENHKFFFDERYAIALDALIREALPQRPSRWQKKKSSEESAPLPLSRVTMDVAILPSGAMKLKMLSIDGKPWKEAVDIHHSMKERIKP